MGAESGHKRSHQTVEAVDEGKRIGEVLMTRFEPRMYLTRGHDKGLVGCLGGLFRLVVEVGCLGGLLQCIITTVCVISKDVLLQSVIHVCYEGRSLGGGDFVNNTSTYTYPSRQRGDIRILMKVLRCIVQIIVALLR